MKHLILMILRVIMILGVIRSYILYRDSFPTPVEAVKDFIIRMTVKSHSPQKIESLNVVSASRSTRQRNEQLLLFQARDRGVQTHIAGYATIRKSLLGWYVDQFQMIGTSSLPSDVLVGQGRSRHGLVIYGQVFLPNAARIEVVFTDETIRADLSQGSFAIFGTSSSEFRMLNVLDNNSNVLRQLTNDELQNSQRTNGITEYAMCRKYLFHPEKRLAKDIAKQHGSYCSSLLR